MTPPPYPLEGVVSWNMNTTCNYRCSYCTQRFIDNRKQWARDVPRFVEAFLALPGDWEIKLSGGEPFLHPEFGALVARLAQGGRRVSVVTNLSAGEAALADYLASTAARPGVFSASLHLEYVAPEAFLDKLCWVAARHPAPVVATCVATRAALPRLPALIAQFAARGQTLRVQPEKQDRDVIDYEPSEREALVAMGGHNGTGMVDPCFEGRLCWAGARYVIVDHRGAAWRCYPARRYKVESLGNVLDGTFRLRSEPAPCRYAYCNCTVPIQRGMVGESNVRGPRQA
jgi:hypothetical protein